MNKKIKIMQKIIYKKFLIVITILIIKKDKNQNNKRVLFKNYQIKSYLCKNKNNLLIKAIYKMKCREV